MKKFIVLLREPDGRSVRHSGAEITLRCTHWNNWLSKYEERGSLEGGSGLTLNGRVIKAKGKPSVMKFIKPEWKSSVVFYY